MKKISTKHILTNFKGESLKEGTTIYTVGLVVSSILGGQVSNPMLGWQLGKKFATEDVVDLKAEEVVFIKKEMEAQKIFGAIITGQMLDLLESTESNFDKKK